MPVLPGTHLTEGAVRTTYNGVLGRGFAPTDSDNCCCDLDWSETLSTGCVKILDGG